VSEPEAELLENLKRLDELERKKAELWRELRVSVAVRLRAKRRGYDADQIAATAYGEGYDRRPVGGSAYLAAVWHKGRDVAHLRTINVVVMADGRRLEIDPVYANGESVYETMGMFANSNTAFARLLVKAWAGKRFGVGRTDRCWYDEGRLGCWLVEVGGETYRAADVVGEYRMEFHEHPEVK
jgi:hypothetical protein